LRAAGRDGTSTCRACVASLPSLPLSLSLARSPHELALTLRSLARSQLPFTVGWQDLKDLFRAAGSIIRADVKMNPDGSHSGTGTVIFETQQDAQTAIGASLVSPVSCSALVHVGERELVRCLRRSDR